MQEFMFYSLSAIILLAAVCVILLPNPLACSMFLAGSMVGLAFMYFTLNAHFIAAVQLAVYAGAVMVLFVMVLMLFDLGKDKEVFSGGKASIFLKVLSGFALLGLLTGGIIAALRNGELQIAPDSSTAMAEMFGSSSAAQMQSVQALAFKIFSQYVLAFEILGLLLLLIAIGVVAVSRIKGGTHAR